MEKKFRYVYASQTSGKNVENLLSRFIRKVVENPDVSGSKLNGDKKEFSYLSCPGWTELPDTYCEGQSHLGTRGSSEPP